MQYKNILLIILITSLVTISIFTAGCTDKETPDGETPTPTATPTSTATQTPTQTPTPEPTPEVPPTPTVEPEQHTIRIQNYMFIPQGGKEINQGDTVKWFNYEGSSSKTRYLVNENDLWDGNQIIKYRRYFSYTFNDSGIYTFYLKGRESIKCNVTVS